MDTAEEVRTNSQATFSHEFHKFLYLDTPVLAN